MYKIGDSVVYPMHGAGVIEDIEQKEVQLKKTVERILETHGRRGALNYEVCLADGPLCS